MNTSEKTFLHYEYVSFVCIRWRASDIIGTTKRSVCV